MASNTSRTMIAALQVSLDGFIQGPHGEKDWVDSWADAIELIPDVDTFVLGGRMYPDYGEYWESIYANPERIPPFQERPGEVGRVRQSDSDLPALTNLAAAQGGQDEKGSTNSSNCRSLVLAHSERGE